MFVYQRLLGKVFFCHFLTAFPKETGSAEEPFAAIPLPQQCMSRGQSRKLPWPQQFNVCEDLIEGWKDRSVKECKGILDFGRSWQGPSDFFSCNPFNISSRGQCPRAAETGHNLILPGFLHMLRYFPIGLKLMSFALWIFHCYVRWYKLSTVKPLLQRQHIAQTPLQCMPFGQPSKTILA